jgi:hypothetical protein
MFWRCLMLRRWARRGFAFWRSLMLRCWARCSRARTLRTYRACSNMGGIVVREVVRFAAARVETGLYGAPARLRVLRGT